MGHSFRRKRSAGQNVMDVHRRETSRMLIATHTRNLDDVVRHLLSFLRENARHVCRSARAECNEEKLDGRGRG